MSLLELGAVVIVPVVKVTEVMSVFAPLWAALKLDLAVAAVDAPVPPLVTARVPVQPKVNDVAASSAVVGAPPNVIVTLVSSVLVSEAEVTPMVGVKPPVDVIGAVALTELT